jgi:hypothetical protein
MFALLLFPPVPKFLTIFVDIKCADGQTRKISLYADIVKVFLAYVLEPITLSMQQPPVLSM